LTAHAAEPAAAAPTAPAAKEVIHIEDAAIQVDLEIMQWDAWRRECSEILPKFAVGIGILYVKWLDDNRPEILGMLSYVEHSKRGATYSVLTPGIGGGVVQEATALSKLSPSDQCAATFEKLKLGGFAVARSYPDMVPVLASYLASHPLSETATRAYDHPLGCMKAALNNKIEFEQAVPMCRCNWESMNSFTPAEWKQYEAAVASKSIDDAQALPQSKRASSKQDACLKALLKP
jgi:hypothetical protein